MFVFHNGHVAAVLLLVLTQRFVFATIIKNENNEVEASSKSIVRSMQVPWINGVDFALRSTENTCEKEMVVTLEALSAGETWALQMLDASSKIQSGLLKGNIRDLGMYDECIEVNGNYNDTNVQGKYCSVVFGTLTSAVCVPSSCNETDVATIVNAVLENVPGTNELKITRTSCISIEPEDFTMGEILTMTFFSGIVVFILFCTICEFITKYKCASPYVILLAKFSLYTNAMALLSTKISPRTMPAIQGIRFLSTCWVILGHRYLNTLLRPMINTIEILDWYNSWTAVYIQTAPFAVDTFFVISGFLLTYLYLKSQQSGTRTNFLMMYIHRYLRLTPCVAVLMLFVAVLLHRVGNGPLWSTLINLHVEPCRKNWWINFLYVQNFVRKNEMCLAHSWYLAVDMQLFWISPLILYPLHRRPKLGLGILSVFLLGSVIAPAVVLAINSYSNAVIRFDITPTKISENFQKYYIPTYNRACAYFVGILFGYDVANKRRKFTSLNVIINWTVACIFMLICGLSTQRVYNTILDYDVVLETAFAVLLRPFWSIAIAWIVYACCFGYGGAVTRFLSLPIFLPLSRLSYSIYLVHMIIQGVRSASAQTPDRFTDFVVLNHFWGDLVLSIVTAFIFSLFFESPVIVLEKLLTNRGQERSSLQEPEKDVEGGIDNKGMT